MKKRIMTYSDNEIINLIRLVNEKVPFAKAFYIVDSFGQMKSGDCSRILKIVDEYLNKDICIGFHGHNNLQLAYANSLELINNDLNRTYMLDSSLNGMGKGAGNVPTELIMNYLNQNYQTDYNLKPIYNIINEVIDDFKKEYTWGYSTNYLLSSLNGCTPSYINFFVNKCHIKSSELPKILSLIEDHKKISFDEIYAEEIYAKYSEKLGDSND